MESNKDQDEIASVSIDLVPGHSTAGGLSDSPISRSDRNLYLGIDVGGTNVKFGIVNACGELIAKTNVSTPSLKSPENVFAYAMDFANQTLTVESPDSQAAPRSGGALEQIAGVGLAVPGVLDTEAFAVREVVNLPGWVDRPLKELLIECCGLPATVVNDANAAAYAEHAARRLGEKSLALVTLGTGVGCGLVIQGSPYSGDHGCAGELGHIAVRFDADALPCTCGSKGHLESYAGSGGVINRLHAAIADRGILHEQIPATLLSKSVSPRDMADCAESGDELCQQVIDDTARFVGQAIGMIGQTIDPAVVLLGGAMTFGGDRTETGKKFLQQVRDTVRETTLVQVGGNIHIDFASLGNDAGVLGAALVVQHAADAAS